MHGIFEATDGQTPLDPDESEGLIPDHIATRGQLNEWELANIDKGVQWAAARRLQPERILSEEFLRQLHRRMFDETWQWAGRFRNTDKNIGVDWQQVSVQLRQLLENLRYRVEQGMEDPDALAVEFHYLLVAIHPFPNGNGRWARVAADLLLQSLGAEPFTWGTAGEAEVAEARQRYLAALRAADRGNLRPLRDFVRS